jgi:hypothetical protein
MKRHIKRKRTFPEELISLRSEVFTALGVKIIEQWGCDVM